MTDYIIAGVFMIMWLIGMIGAIHDLRKEIKDNGKEEIL